MDRRNFIDDGPVQGHHGHTALHAPIAPVNTGYPPQVVPLAAAPINRPAEPPKRSSSFVSLGPASALFSYQPAPGSPLTHHHGHMPAMSQQQGGMPMGGGMNTPTGAYSSHGSLPQYQYPQPVHQQPVGVAYYQPVGQPYAQPPMAMHAGPIAPQYSPTLSQASQPGPYSLSAQSYARPHTPPGSNGLPTVGSTLPASPLSTGTTVSNGYVQASMPMFMPVSLSAVVAGQLLPGQGQGQSSAASGFDQAERQRLEAEERRKREIEQQQDRLREQQAKVQQLQNEQARALREEQEKEKLDQERRLAERERLRQEEEKKRMEAVRKEKEKLEEEMRQEYLRQERMRLELFMQEQERQKQEQMRVEQERLRQEHALRVQEQMAQQERLRQEQAKIEEERQRLEKERLEREKQEKERQERERLDRIRREEERQRLIREKQDEERQRLEKERLEKERLEKERQERERQERLKREEDQRRALEWERQERERQDKERQEREKQERLKWEEQERQRLEKERQERERQERLKREEELQKALERERVNREKQERELAELQEQERLQRERLRKEQERMAEEVRKQQEEVRRAHEEMQKERERMARQFQLEQQRIEEERERMRLQQETMRNERLARERLAEEEKQERIRKQEQERLRVQQEQHQTFLQQQQEMLRIEQARLDQMRAQFQSQTPSFSALPTQLPPGSNEHTSPTLGFDTTWVAFANHPPAPGSEGSNAGRVPAVTPRTSAEGSKSDSFAAFFDTRGLDVQPLPGASNPPPQPQRKDSDSARDRSSAGYGTLPLKKGGSTILLRPPTGDRRDERSPRDRMGSGDRSRTVDTDLRGQLREPRDGDRSGSDRSGDSRSERSSRERERQDSDAAERSRLGLVSPPRRRSDTHRAETLRPSGGREREHERERERERSGQAPHSNEEEEKRARARSLADRPLPKPLTHQKSDLPAYAGRSGSNNGSSGNLNKSSGGTAKVIAADLEKKLGHITPGVTMSSSTPRRDPRDRKDSYGPGRENGSDEGGRRGFDSRREDELEAKAKEREKERERVEFERGSDARQKSKGKEASDSSGRKKSGPQPVPLQRNKTGPAAAKSPGVGSSSQSFIVFDKRERDAVAASRARDDSDVNQRHHTPIPVRPMPPVPGSVSNSNSNSNGNGGGQLSPTGSNTPRRGLPVPKPAPRKQLPRRPLVPEEAASRLQARWRSFAARRAYKELVLRAKTAREIVSSEQVYVGSLGVLLEVFARPLKRAWESGKPIITPADTEAIFAGLEEIHRYHVALLSRLESRVEYWNVDSCMGEIFLEMEDDFVHLYSDFTNNYDTALETVQRCKDLKPFKTFLQRCIQHPECGGLSLEAFLILPVQRVTRYVILVRELHRRTDPLHRDYNALKAAQEYMDGVCVRVNENKRVAENQKKAFLTLVELQRVIKPKDLVKDLAIDGRSLIRQSLIVRYDQHADKRREVTFFLFSDLIIVAKETKRKNGKFRATTRMNLREDNIRLEIMADNTNFMGQDIRNAFVLHTPRESFLFFCNSPEERTTLTEPIRQVLSARA